MNTDEQRVFDDALVDWLVDSNQPFISVSNEKFRLFCHLLNEKYTLPSATTMVGLFEARYTQLVESVAKETRAARFPSYSLDLWKSVKKDYYCSIALHYITDDWELKHPLIATTLVLGDHTAANIGKLAAEQIPRFLGMEFTD